MLNRLYLLGVLVLVTTPTGALMPGRQVFALPPGGTDALTVSAQAHLTSRLGQETIFFAGQATIVRSDPYMDGSVEVVDLEIVSLVLNGNSVTGPVTITQSPTLASLGEIRGDWPSPPSMDMFLEISAPASPNPTISLHNDASIHVQTMYQGSPIAISTWPPTAVPWEADLATCAPLMPTLPKDVCITELSFTLSGTTLGGVGGVSELAPLGASGGRQDMVLAGLSFVLLFGAAGWSAYRVMAR